MVHSVQEYIETPDAPSGWEPSIFRDVQYSRAQTYSPLGSIRTQNYDPGVYIPVGQAVIEQLVDAAATGAPISVVDVVPTAAPEIFPTVTVAGDTGVDAQEGMVIDPEVDTSLVVFEEETEEPVFDQTIFSPPIWTWDGRARKPIDWDRVYDDYVVLNPDYEEPAVDPDPPPEPILAEVEVIEPEEEVVEMAAFDWGDFAGAVAGGIWDPLGLGTAARQTFATPTGAGTPAVPRTVTVDTVTGKVTRCRRRRRRRLLTNGDFNDLLRISTLPNKDTVKIALAKAIR